MKPGTEGNEFTWILDSRYMSKDIIIPNEDGQWKVYIDENGDACISSKTREEQLKDLKLGYEWDSRRLGKNSYYRRKK